MSRANPLWGAPRIHGELLKLGIEVSQSIVSKYMIRRPKPPSQSWWAFLRNRVSCLASLDFFTVATATYAILLVFIALRHDRRRILHVGVTAQPSAPWLARQMREAFPWDTAPQYLIRDRDGTYGSVFRDRVTAMGIVEIVIAPRSPWQNAYAERVSGSIRRECLDHVMVFNAWHLRRRLRAYLSHYHKTRAHLSRGKDTPDGRPVEPPDSAKIIAFPQVGGLHHRDERLAA